jgi:hypothetical protein
MANLPRGVEDWPVPPTVTRCFTGPRHARRARSNLIRAPASLPSGAVPRRSLRLLPALGDDLLTTTGQIDA